MLSITRCLRSVSVRFNAARMMASLPAHQIVGLPSLSPTMTNGNISKWEKQVGDKVVAGDSIAQVETDKAAMSFDAQDEFYVAKHLVKEGDDVPVGTPVMITVDDASDVAAFANYVHTATPAAAVVASPDPPKPAAPTIEPPKPIQAAAPVVEAVPPPVVIPPPVPKATATPTTASPQVPWGDGIKSSPILFRLSKLQSEYESKYGYSGYSPLQIQVEKKK